METRTALTGARIFDGVNLHDGAVLVIDGGHVGGIAEAPPDGVRCIALDGGILAPGFVDLQVNGGGGEMVGAGLTPETLSRIADAHARLGATTILPTLITDTDAATRDVIAAVAQAVSDDMAGIGGLHLEGPHLSPDKAGAHDPELIRPMTNADIDALCRAAAKLPVLMVTLAPEVVPDGAIARLTAAGVIVSLGHTQADFDTCRAAADAGATSATHLFNAMAGLSHRAPGPVGAALDDGRLSAGLIADGHHVHAAAIGLALRAKRGPGRIFLVSDAMAVAGTEADHMTLGGRRIDRRAGRLTLADGTLAGADLDLATALRVVRQAGAPLAEALAMVTSIPAGVAGLADWAGHLRPGAPADIVHLDDDLHLTRVWRRGTAIAPALPL